LLILDNEFIEKISKQLNLYENNQQTFWILLRRSS